MDARRVSISRSERDPDPRYRPTPALAAAVLAQADRELDRPLVPLLNALWAIGVITLASCAGHVDVPFSRPYLMIAGADARTVRVARQLAALLPDGELEVVASSHRIREDTTLRWRPPEAAAVAFLDGRFLEIPSLLRQLQLDSVDRPAPEQRLVDNIAGALAGRWRQPVRVQGTFRSSVPGAAIEAGLTAFVPFAPGAYLEAWSWEGEGVTLLDLFEHAQGALTEVS